MAIRLLLCGEAKKKQKQKVLSTGGAQQSIHVNRRFISCCCSRFTVTQLSRRQHSTFSKRRKEIVLLFTAHLVNCLLHKQWRNPVYNSGGRRKLGCGGRGLGVGKGRE